MRKILVIQTAFIGDVILATAIVEKLFTFYPDAKIDFLVRKGNESLLENHPKINSVLIWNKKTNKFKHLFALKKQIKNEAYDAVISAQRYTSAGYLVANSGAKHRIGFRGNPFSFRFTFKVDHSLKGEQHEIDRNQQLISEITDNLSVKPKLYPNEANLKTIAEYQRQRYVCMAPASVWFTKQLPKQKWLELIQQFKNKSMTVFLLGGPSDAIQNEYIQASAFQDNVVNLAGELTFLESAALMKGAEMNYVNDSGPLHIASAVNAPVTAFFCSTLPSFGFGPLSDKSKIVEVEDLLACRPCGAHGKKACPKKHFKCGHDIKLPEALV